METVVARVIKREETVETVNLIKESKGEGIFYNRIYGFHSFIAFDYSFHDGFQRFPAVS